ncbi:MAG: hypothetical protein ACE149_20065, partial [Armatimonadota bacterium]
MTLHECTRTVHQSCQDYWQERKRVRTALSQCPLCRQRKGEKRVWCRADAEPVECFGWPEDCPKYWRHRALQAEAGHFVCGKCGHTSGTEQDAMPVREVVGAQTVGLPGAEVQ